MSDAQLLNAYIKEHLPTAPNEELVSRFTAWVEEYAAKVCPPGCMPLPSQDAEITLFADVVRGLMHLPPRPHVDRDVKRVGGPRSHPFFECPGCGKDIANADETHAANCNRAT